MDFSFNLYHPAPPDTIASMLMNPEFFAMRLYRARKLRPQIETFPNGIRAQVIIPPEDLPREGRGVFGGKIAPNLEIVEHWTRHPDGSWTGQSSITEAEMPVSAQLSQWLRMGPNWTTERQINATITARIPFFGAQFESAMAPMLTTLADEEVLTVAQWLQDEAMRR